MFYQVSDAHKAASQLSSCWTGKGRAEECKWQEHPVVSTQRCWALIHRQASGSRGHAVSLVLCCWFHEARFCRGAQVRYQETEKSTFQPGHRLLLSVCFGLPQRAPSDGKDHFAKIYLKITALNCTLWITIWLLLTYKSGILENMV